MSLLDDLRKLEQQLVSRLKELEPLIGEYNQLRKLAQRLGVGYTPPEEDTAATAATTRPAAAKRRTSSKRSAAKTRRTPRTPSKDAAKRVSQTRPAAAKDAANARSTETSATAAPATQGRTAAPKTPARRTRVRKAASARPGQRSDDVLRLVGEHPGITVREIGERLSVDATGLYRVANKLTADGRLRKDGTQLYSVESTAAEPNSSVETAPRSAGDTNAPSASPAPAGATGAPSAGSKPTSSR